MAKINRNQKSEIRNEIAHEYSFNTAEIVESISNVNNICRGLVSINQAVNDFCQANYFVVAQRV